MWQTSRWALAGAGACLLPSQLLLALWDAVPLLLCCRRLRWLRHALL